MGRFIIIGERIHCISPVIREAMNTMNPEPILARAKEQLDAGATYIDVNIGPAESNGPELMTWAVKLLQENFNTFRWHWIRLIKLQSRLVSLFTIVTRANPSLTPLTLATDSAMLTWLLPTMQSLSLCAPRALFPEV